MNSGTLSEAMLGILYAAPSLIQTLVLLGGIVFAMTQIHKFPKPAIWLALGLSLMLIARVMGWAGTLFLSRTTTATEFASSNVMLSTMLVLVSTAGLAVVIGAVFVSRSSHASAEFPGREGRVRKPAGSTNNPNPYTAPSSADEHH
jgi:uncharacterized membrane protein SirB2